MVEKMHIDNINCGKKKKKTDKYGWTILKVFFTYILMNKVQAYLTYAICD